MKKKIITAANIIVSIALVGLLLYFVGFQHVLQGLSEINLFLLFLSIFFTFLVDLIMSYRIKILLEDMKEKMRFIDILKSHFVGMLAADFTPARTGYFATAAAMKYKYKVPSEKAMVSIFGPQIFDFAVKLIFGTIGIFYIAIYLINIEEWWILLIGAVAMTAIIGTMILVLFSRRFILLFSFFENIPFISRLYAMTVRMQQNAKTVISKAGMIMQLVGIGWVFKTLALYFAAKSVGITIDFGYPEILFYFFLQPLVTMLEFVPTTTIAGLGLSEGANVLLFSLFGADPAAAMLFALVARFKTTLLHLPAVPEALKIYPVR